jgi:hypothetical protein
VGLKCWNLQFWLLANYTITELFILQEGASPLFCLYLWDSGFVTKWLQDCETPRYSLMVPIPSDSFFPVLGFELRAYTLSHSTSPFFVMGFFFQDRVLQPICQELASHLNPPDLCLLISEDYSCDSFFNLLSET